MQKKDSKTSVVAAVVGNFVVMVAKFIGFGVTSSGTILAEAIHTLADVMNQVLLLVDLLRSSKNDDTEHSSGYGRERFIWALISAVGIFFLGCGVANRELLIGQSIPKEDLQKLQTILSSKSFLGKIDHIRTEVIGSEQYDIQLEIDFDEGPLARRMNLNLHEAWNSMETFEDFQKFSTSLATDSMRNLTRIIDELEAEVKKKFQKPSILILNPIKIALQ